MTGKPAVDPAELRERAEAVLDPVHYAYFAGGAGAETALADNEWALQRLALLPRVLRDVSSRDLSVELGGERLSMPVLLSPTAFHRLAHPDGELATARACAAAGTVLIASMAATTAITDIVATAREVDEDAAVWFQIYPQPRQDVTEHLIRRAEDAGCSALVVTVDSAVFGYRERDRRHGFDDLPPGLTTENMRHLPGGPADGSATDIAMPAHLDWDALARLRESTRLPVWLKGILHPADARAALAHRVDGVIVSNHGGRQLGSAVAAVEALPAVAAAVAGQVPIIMDGGIRRGEDVVKALALGATAVGVGRPAIWGLATAGEAGVQRVLNLLREDVDRALALCGVRSPGELTPDFVVRRGIAP